MNENSRIDELQSRPQETIPASEKEGGASKLDRLEAQELIPPEFADLKEISGPIKALVRKTGRFLSYVIVDTGQMTQDQIEEDFTYFYGETLEEFPELKLGENKYARPLVHGSVSEISPEMLFGVMFETNPVLRGKGAGVAFQEHLANLARNLGYKFLTGYQNDARTAGFFLRRGRYLLEEVKDELQGEFESLKNQEPDGTVFYTVKFLNPEDIAKYVKPERIGTDVQDKIMFREKVFTLDGIFFELTETLKKAEEDQATPGDRAILVKIMADLNEILAEDERYNLSEPSETDDDFVPKSKRFLEHLKSKVSALARRASLEQLKENYLSIAPS